MRPIELDIAHASCTPTPQDECDAAGGLGVVVLGTWVCLTPLDPGNPPPTQQIISNAIQAAIEVVNDCTPVWDCVEIQH